MSAKAPVAKLSNGESSWANDVQSDDVEATQLHKGLANRRASKIFLNSSGTLGLTLTPIEPKFLNILSQKESAVP